MPYISKSFVSLPIIRYLYPRDMDTKNRFPNLRQGDRGYYFYKRELE